MNGFTPKAPDCPVVDFQFCMTDRCVFWHDVFRLCIHGELQLPERARKRLRRRERVVGGKHGL